MARVREVREESQEWEGDLIFTVRRQQLREPDRLEQISLKHRLRGEILFCCFLSQCMVKC